MEKVAPDIAYRRLKYVSDWRLVEENQRAALAGIVHGISRLDAAGHWGDGTTSASDGQRFAMPHKVPSTAAFVRAPDCIGCCRSTAGTHHPSVPSTPGHPLPVRGDPVALGRRPGDGATTRRLGLVDPRACGANFYPDCRDGAHEG